MIYKTYEVLLDHVRNASYFEGGCVSWGDIYPPAHSWPVQRLLLVAAHKNRPDTCPMSTMLAFPSYIDTTMDFLELKMPQRLQIPDHPTARGGCKVCHTSVCL